jgi:hypothetical protein
VSFAHEIRQVCLRLIALLEERSTPYALMGGIAVPIWGVPRATYDVDVVLSVDEEGLRAFLARAREHGFQVSSSFDSGFRDILQGMEKVRLEWWTESSRMVEVDVFLVSTSYQKAAFSRRERVRFDRREVWVLSAADLVLHKLVAGRPKDLADVQNILSVQGVIDRPYLLEWGGRLGVSELLRRAMEEAQPGGDER